MSAVAASAQATEHRSPPPGTLEVGIATFAVLNIALALFMAISPHGFYTVVGPFEAFNQHYIRAADDGGLGGVDALAEHGLGE